MTISASAGFSWLLSQDLYNRCVLFLLTLIQQTYFIFIYVNTAGVLNFLLIITGPKV